MRPSWMRNILLFSTALLLLASCKDPEFSLDEPLIPELRPLVYINGQNNFLYALDPKTGERVWEKFFGVNTILQEPLILKNRALVSSNAGIVILDADKGTVIDTIKNINIGGVDQTLAPAISGIDETVYFGTANDYLVAYNFISKAVVWQAPISGASTIKTSGSFFGNLFIVSAGNTIYALNRNQGAALAWTYAAPGPFNNPVISAPNMFVLGTNGELHVVDLETGVEIWSYVTGAPTSSSPVVYGGNIIYGADDNRLYCIDSIARAPRWVFVTDERVKGSAFAYEQAVYFGSYDHYVYSVDIRNAQLNWRYRTGALITSSPIVNNGIAYFGSYDQQFYAFDTSGALKYKFKVNSPIDLSPVANNLDGKITYPAVSGLSAQ